MNYAKLSDTWSGNYIENFRATHDRALTVIITASLVPSHPSIEMIQKVIESLKLINLPENTEIILAHDADNHDNYEQYLVNLEEFVEKYNNIKIIRRDTRGYLIGNIDNALKYVKTKYVLVCQHDLAFKGYFDINKVLEDMIENPKIKHALFNIWDNNPRTHEPNMNFHTNKNGFFTEIEQTNYRYVKTHSWSDQNHLCLKSYYTDFVMPETKKALKKDLEANGLPSSGCGAMEIYLNDRVETLDQHDVHGTYIIGGLGHESSLQNLHGRGNGDETVAHSWNWDFD